MALTLVHMPHRFACDELQDRAPKLFAGFMTHENHLRSPDAIHHAKVFGRADLRNELHRGREC
jgi:hypothetical protein